ncbi:serine-rich adhesin for platelets [Cucumis melo var. makuwa]|uniref:Uncharacterized protein DDB_G0271670 n=2 Tax=Cucumis melo TaxID=3656 RepID=A0A1S3AY44_CUCME|nr:uncharacterized protein LOC103483856 [Cucumis melo]KAA0049506.1 serine-rich adhesin for platelets [Cucumis melo var. makuwa]TYK16186.1 serine-rich adhesin for platelets [Cucumis melo var. makuwa]
MVQIPNADDDDMDDGMKCSYHPYRTNQGGICALCLQEKLGKLVSSSPLPLPPSSSSSSSSSSFRSDFATARHSALSSLQFPPQNRSHCHDHAAPARTRIPFLSKKKKKQPEVGFRRSKSTTTPARGKFLDPYHAEDYSPKNRGWIWSLFDLSTKSHSTRKIDHGGLRESSKIASLPTAATSEKLKGKCTETSKDFCNTGRAEDDDGGGDDSPNSSQASASVSSFERKVSRSRSVGCGSRSFSGDFFERITGFGDCTLRRVESHREGKPKINPTAVATVPDGNDSLKERVKCGGIFGGFTIQTSSSSSSASSSYWVSSSSGEEGRFQQAATYGQAGRSKNKGWAFASPMRAFTKPSSSSSEGKRESSEKNSTPNLDAIPSLLAVRI